MSAAIFQDAHFWIAIALLVFLAILWRAKAPALVLRALDEAGAKVQAQLDEAARLRDEAAALLAQIQTQREETEKTAAAMLRAAEADAARLRTEAHVALEGEIQRRRALAERRIATAESQAASEVKAAATDLAASIAESILAARLARAGADPAIDVSLEALSGRFS